MPIEIVGSLRAGAIAALLEVFALAMGLLIAANLQSIVTLTARRRLYSHGTARLRDSTWNVGIVEGLTNPRRLLRDCRAMLAFVLAVIVILLEVLTVLQTQKGDSCDFYTPSTWNIVKSDQKCFSLNQDIILSSEYLAGAKLKTADVDLKFGIPKDTNVFENSVISGPAVEQLKKYEERYVVPEIDVFDSTVTVTATGTSRTQYKEATGRDDNQARCGNIYEPAEFVPRDLEILEIREGIMFSVASTGFVEVFGCRDVLTVRVCNYNKGRVVTPDVTVLVGKELDAKCKIYKVSREGRKTDVRHIASALFGIKEVGLNEIRRAVIVSLTAENSASTKNCKRYTAVPKECTQIGWVSLGAVLILGVLFVSTSLLRVGLKLSSRDAVDYNGNQERLAQSIFEHFDGYHRSTRDFITPGKHKTFTQRLQSMFLGAPLAHDDIHVSILKSSREPDAYHLTWTRDPIGVEPAVHVPSNSIIPTAESKEDEIEVSLV